jgi:hypothetical protein
MPTTRNHAEKEKFKSGEQWENKHTTTSQEQPKNQKKAAPPYRHAITPKRCLVASSITPKQVAARQNPTASRTKRQRTDESDDVLVHVVICLVGVGRLVAPLCIKSWTLRFVGCWIRVPTDFSFSEPIGRHRWGGRRTLRNVGDLSGILRGQRGMWGRTLRNVGM